MLLGSEGGPCRASTARSVACSTRCVRTGAGRVLQGRHISLTHTFTHNKHQFASAPMRSSPFADNPWFLCVVVTILLATVLLIGGTRSSLAHAGRAVAAAPKSRSVQATAVHKEGAVANVETKPETSDESSRHRLRASRLRFL